MAKPEWGTKRICLNCAARFYDFSRDPIICPACGTPFDPTAQSRSRRSRAPAKAVVATAAAVAAVEPVAESDTEAEVEVEADDEVDEDLDEAAESSGGAEADEEDGEDDTDSAIEDVSELGDDDMADVIETEIDENEEER